MGHFTMGLCKALCGLANIYGEYQSTEPDVMGLRFLIYKISNQEMLAINYRGYELSSTDTKLITFGENI